jgi:O-antigen/teichoic acid export membrane protein
MSKQLSRGVCWTVLGTVASRGGAFLVSLVLARNLGRELFGELGIIESSVAMFVALGGLGLPLTATKFVSKYREQDPNRAGRILSLCLAGAGGAGLVIAAAAVTLAPWLAQTQLAAPHLAGQLTLAAGVVLSTVLNATVAGALGGFQAFRSIALASAIVSFISIPIVVTFGLQWRLWGVVSGYLVTQLLLLAFNGASLIRHCRANSVPLQGWSCWQEWRVLWEVSLPALLNSALFSPVNWMCVALLVNTAGGYAEMGTLNLVNVWFLLLMFLPGQLAQVYFPMIEQHLAAGNTLVARKLVWKSARLNLLVCTVVACGVSLLSGLILQAYGPEYASARWALVITVWTACVTGAQQPFAIYLVARSRLWLVFCCSIAWASTYYALSWALVGWGAEGIVVSRLISYFLYALISVGCGIHLLGSSERQHLSESTLSDEPGLLTQAA